MREALSESLRAHFLPEFLNRVDETIVFHPLDREQVSKIVDLQLEKLAEVLRRRELNLVVTEAARKQIAVEGYDPIFGARPVKRVIQQSVQNPLATELLKGEFPEGATIEVDYDGQEFTFRRIKQAEPALSR
jgi:ATP-dependent Clp protease ATP-binding subunit ClpB